MREEIWIPGEKNLTLETLIKNGWWLWKQSGSVLAVQTFGISLSAVIYIEM